MTASLDYTIGYAEAAGGEDLPPKPTPDYVRGWWDYFIERDGVKVAFSPDGLGGATWRFVEGQ